MIDSGRCGRWRLDADGDTQPLAPSTLSQLGDIFLAAGELALSVLGVQQEAGKIAETIKDQTRDFAGKMQLALRTFVRRLRAAVATRRRQDLAWVSSERRHAASDLFEVAPEHGIPAIVMRNTPVNPAQHREQPLL